MHSNQFSQKGFRFNVDHHTNFEKFGAQSTLTPDDMFEKTGTSKLC